MPNETIEYTGNFKTIRDIADGMNNYTPAPSEDPRFEVHEYVDINGNTVNALYQIVEDNT